MLSELIKEISAGSGMTSVYHCYKRTGRLADSGEEWLQCKGRASLPLTTAFARLALSIFLAQWSGPKEQRLVGPYAVDINGPIEFFPFGYSLS